MAESPTYTTAQVIALAQGTTNWYDYAKSGFQHVKNNVDDVAALSGGGAPGWNAAIDTRWYVADTSSSTTTYTGTTNPTATGSDSIATGYHIRFKPASNNTAASTLNVGSADGAVDIKKMSGGAKTALAAGDLDSDCIYDFVFDGTDWIATLPQHFGNGTALDMEDTVLTRPEIKDYSETKAALTPGASVTIDLSTGNVFTITADQNTTFTFSNPSPTGKSCAFTLIWTQDSSDRTATWPASVDWAAATAPTLTSGSAKRDVFTFFTLDAGTIWYGFTAGQDMS